MDAPRFRIVNTWNGGEGGEKTVFESQTTGDSGLSECWRWIHSFTPFSVDEATKNQGYLIQEVRDG